MFDVFIHGAPGYFNPSATIRGRPGTVNSFLSCASRLTARNESATLKAAGVNPQ
jgi:hypothetical protein